MPEVSSRTDDSARSAPRTDDQVVIETGRPGDQGGPVLVRGRQRRLGGRPAGGGSVAALGGPAVHADPDQGGVEPDRRDDRRAADQGRSAGTRPPSRPGGTSAAPAAPGRGRAAAGCRAHRSPRPRPAPRDATASPPGPRGPWPAGSDPRRRRSPPGGSATGLGRATSAQDRAAFSAIGRPWSCSSEIAAMAPTRSANARCRRGTARSAPRSAPPGRPRTGPAQGRRRSAARSPPARRARPPADQRGDPGVGGRVQFSPGPAARRSDHGRPVRMSPRRRPQQVGHVGSGVGGYSDVSGSVRAAHPTILVHRVGGHPTSPRGSRLRLPTPSHDGARPADRRATVVRRIV